MARRGGQDKDKERFWRGVVGRWRRSGLTVRVFCDEEGVSEPSFYAWRRTIAERDQWATRSTRGAGADETPVFVPLRVMSTPTPASAGLELEVGAGQVVRVPPDFDAVTLRRLLAVLREAPSC